MPNFLPVFADGGAIVGILVLIFTVVSWLVNLANSQNNPPAAEQNRPQPARGQGDRVQNEIDIFLQDVRGQKNAEQDDGILAYAPPNSARQPRSSTASPPPRDPNRSRLGSMTTHVESHVGESLSSHHLESSVRDSQASTDQRKSRATVMQVALQQGSGAEKNTPLPIINLLRDRQGIRQAILVNEILSKPKALRDE